MEEQEKEPIALHVLVVGFHHKKGMQVEYAYPPLSDGEDGTELPELWRHLPSLCLPDGSHNHEADAVYFHLPHLTKPDQTVFGVSCYRQIDSEKVTNKTADITRNTVQKSVCVISTLPIYGYIQERLQVTTKVYFKGADFSDVQDLAGLYLDLNNTNWRDKLSHGVCVSDAVRVFGRNILVLFKLLLLEKKVLFWHSPVGPLVRTIVSLLALLPNNIPDGLTQAASQRSRGAPSLDGLRLYHDQLDNLAPVSTAQEALAHNSNEVDPEELKAMEAYKCLPPNGDINSTLKSRVQESSCDNDNISLCEESEPGKIINVTTEESNIALPPSQVCETIGEESDRRSSISSLTSVTSRGSMSIMSPGELAGGGAATTTRMGSLKGRISGALSYWSSPKNDKSPPSQDKPSATATPAPSPSEPGDDIAMSPSSSSMLGSAAEEGSFLGDSETLTPPLPMQSPPEKFAALNSSECGLPLQLFTKGNLVHPYLSLQYLDVLNSPSSRGFIVGASNALFIHKKNLYDVLVQVEDGKIEIPDPELRKQLSLSMEDLRFAENIVRQVEAVSATLGNKSGSNGISGSNTGHPDVFLEGIGWVGGEEWLRYQFKVYLMSLLRSSFYPDGSREVEVFNGSYVSLLRGAHSYRVWSAEGPYPALMELTAGHPHAGHLSMSDMRIRLSHTIQGLDKGRRINQTFVNTGAAAVKTKEAVGGAITSAKGAITNLWSSFTTTNNNAAGSEVEVSEMGSSEATEAIEATEIDNSSINPEESEKTYSSQKTEPKITPNMIPTNSTEDDNAEETAEEAVEENQNQNSPEKTL